jgi:hypothetical protein
MDSNWSYSTTNNLHILTSLTSIAIIPLDIHGIIKMTRLQVSVIHLLEKVNGFFMSTGICKEYGILAGDKGV